MTATTGKVPSKPRAKKPGKEKARSGTTSRMPKDVAEGDIVEVSIGYRPEGDAVHSEFSGRFSDLKASEQHLANWRVGQSQLVHAEIPPTTVSDFAFVPYSLPHQYPDTFSVHPARVTVDESLHAAAKGAADATVELYLMRSSNVSAAQALSRFDVTLDRGGRSRQLARLKEFRSDTEAESNSEIERWIDARLQGRTSLKSSGAISAGVVISMTYEEAQRLRSEVPSLHVLRNQALTLIAPTASSQPVPQLPELATWHLEAIGMSAARRDGKAFSGKGVTIVMMDTGVQLGHPEITGKVVTALKIRDNPTTVDFKAVEVDSAHFDTDGHGTHVAGLICGKSIGVAPDARLISILMMPRRLATTFDFIRCLDWAAEHPEVSLVNVSAGITPFTADMIPFIADIINTGALPIAAVGNDGVNNTRSPGNYIDGASVGSVDPHDGQRVSAFSGSGQLVLNQAIYTVPDLVAPGGQVWSCSPGTQYASLSGTSMAAPIVCGVAACLIEQAGGLLSPLELMDQLSRSCVKLASEGTIRQGAGLVQVPRRP